ncbi:ATP-binding protein [Actinoallomurus soli]|uniref:ATP-binding protein n=1 Tax=Actinoallomurus soli TaxID=2952535 RepID=UPI00209277E6|nr:ATP-binding protein [Actinoallomurus soli]MCO5973271.1 ATP-binding protein [Actinoallomurus soli]
MTGESVDEAHEWLLSAIARGGRWPGHLVPPARMGSDAMTRDLAALPESVREAREFTRDGLRTWGLAAMYDDVGLVVSELVTNAIRYAVGATAGPGDTPVRLGLLRTVGRLTCAVADPSDEVPQQGEADFVSQSGRGLYLVAAFSDAWNWTPLYGHGKVVWATFTTRGS